MSVDNAIEAIYQSLQNNNEDLDLRIADLKAAMKAQDVKEVQFEGAKLAQSNRQGRKLMQSYFKQKGVKIGFI